MQKRNVRFSARLSFFTKLLISYLAFSLCFRCSGNTIAYASEETQGQIPISGEPQRIAVFSLFAEEMLLEMIGPDRIVYVGHEYFENGETYSPTMELTKNIAGQYLNMVDEEEVLSLNPDLIVLDNFLRNNYTEFFPALHRADIPFLFLSEPETIEDIRNVLFDLGEIVGAPEKAAQMAENMDAGLTKISKIVSSIPEDKRRRVAFFDSNSPNIYHAKKFNMIACAAGTININGVTADYLVPGRSPEHLELDKTLLTEGNPDLIVFDPIVYDTDGYVYDVGVEYAENEIVSLLNNPELSNVTAIQSGKVYPLSFYESQFVVQSVMELAQTAYPDLFPKIDN